jgi:hypothetical protein
MGHHRRPQITVLGSGIVDPGNEQAAVAGGSPAGMICQGERAPLPSYIDRVIPSFSCRRKTLNVC